MVGGNMWLEAWSWAVKSDNQFVFKEELNVVNLSEVLLNATR